MYFRGREQNSIYRVRSFPCASATTLLLSSLINPRQSARSLAIQEGATRTPSPAAAFDSARRTRRNLRFPIEAEAVFWWSDQEGKYQEATGRSRDVSIRGAFILAPVCPPIGVAVEIIVLIPSFSNLRGGLRIAGRVVRVEDAGFDAASRGFAAWGDGASFAEGEHDGDELN